MASAGVLKPRPTSLYQRLVLELTFFPPTHNHHEQPHTRQPTSPPHRDLPFVGGRLVYSPLTLALLKMGCLAKCLAVVAFCSILPVQFATSEWRRVSFQSIEVLLIASGDVLGYAGWLDRCGMQAGSGRYRRGWGDGMVGLLRSWV
jgi:hypothetical protein